MTKDKSSHILAFCNYNISTVRNQSNRSYHVGLPETETIPRLRRSQSTGDTAARPSLCSGHQRTEADPRQRQTAHSLFVPSRHHRKWGAIGVQDNLCRALDHLPVFSGVDVAFSNELVQQ